MNAFTEDRVAVSKDPAVELFVARADGPAEHCLLAVHGGPEWDHTYLREPLVRLAGERRLILPDLRGCGRSTADLAPEHYTPDSAVADLVALLEILRAEGVERVDVIGFSYGGRVVQRLALAAPERVRSLIVASSSVLPVRQSDFAGWAERDAVHAAQVDVWPGARPPDPRLSRADAFASARASVWRPESLPGYLRRLEDIRFTGAWQEPWLRDMLPPSLPEDAVGRLAALDMPILLLHGRQDMTFPVADVWRAGELLPNASVAVVEDAGHMAHVDAPEEWLAALRGFLESTSD